VSVDGRDTVIGAQLCGIPLGFARKKIKIIMTPIGDDINNNKC